MFPHSSWFLSLGILLVLSSVVLFGQEAPIQQQRLPEPAAEAQRESEKLIREVFKEEYARKSPADQKALAKKLLQQGIETRDDPTARYVLLREAADVASDAGDLSLALQAVEEMARLYAVHGRAMKKDILAKCKKAMLQGGGGSTLAEAYLLLAEESLAAEDYEGAMDAAREAETAAQKAKDLPLVTRARANAKEVGDLQKYGEKVAAARVKLTTQPEDGESNLVVGRYLCFIRGDWGLGLPYLAKGSDPRIKTVSEGDLSDPKDSADQLSVGDGWWDLGEKEARRGKDQLRQRATYWYWRALNGLRGLARSKVERRLMETMARKGEGFDLLKWIDLRKDAVGGDWQLSEGGLISPSGAVRAACEIPYAPGEEFDLAVVIEKKDRASEVSIGVWSPQCQFIVLIDGWGGAKSTIGVNDGVNPPKTLVRYENNAVPGGKAAAILCAVRKGSIKVSVDGKVILKLEGDFKNQSWGNKGSHNASPKKALFVGCNVNPVTFKSIMLVPISGLGERLR